jgi:hypothetical protein
MTLAAWFLQVALPNSFNLSNSRRFSFGFGEANFPVRGLPAGGYQNSYGYTINGMRCFHLQCPFLPNILIFSPLGRKNDTQ